MIYTRLSSFPGKWSGCQTPSGNCGWSPGKTEPNPNLKTEPNPNLKTEPTPNLKTKPNPNLKTKPNPNLKTKPNPNLKTKPNPNLKTRPKPPRKEVRTAHKKITPNSSKSLRMPRWPSRRTSTVWP